MTTLEACEGIGAVIAASACGDGGSCEGGDTM